MPLPAGVVIYGCPTAQAICAAVTVGKQSFPPPPQLRGAMQSKPFMGQSALDVQGCMWPRTWHWWDVELHTTWVLSEGYIP
jgi:hypothetical protein